MEGMNSSSVFKFGEFTLNVRERHLSKRGVTIPLEPKTHELLAVLVRRAGQLTTKHELLALVWPDAFVEQSILAVHVSNLRKSLGDKTHQYIETVPRLGYRFTAPVRPVHARADRRGRAQGAGSRNHEAVRLYLRGRYLWERRTHDSAVKAIRYFEAALTNDPEFALAWSGLSACYATLPLTSGVQPGEAFPKSKAAAVKALELDAALCEAHVSLAGVKFWYDWDWAGAEREFRCAIDLDPDATGARRFFGHFLSNMGRHEEALRETGRALELEPLSIVTNTRMGQFLYQAGEYDRALEQLRGTFELEPNFWMAHLIFGRVLDTIGRQSEAIAAFRRAAAMAATSGEARAAVGYALARSGDTDAGRHVRDELAARRRRDFSDSYHVALVSAGLADHDAVHDWLNRALADRDLGLTFMRVEPRWRPYERDPVVRRIIGTVAFPPG
jgi:DNA-binding winged helix-turn-helix (wHTH) protein/tetratricopeptide (TPR) repeat protein